MADRKNSRPKNEDANGMAESQVVAGATFNDLDLEKVRSYLATLDETADDRSNTADDPAKRLESLGLVHNVAAEYRPTTVALLLFGKQPQKYLPQASIKLARFRGTDVDGIIADRKEVFGTLDKLIEDTARFVTNNMRVQGRIDGLYRADVPEYPLVAVREAITNAVAHRDYSIMGQKVTVRMFDDRLEVESPGGLAGSVTLETLGQKRYSRNPLLARLMYELRLIEEMGTGIRRMRRAMAELGSPAPDFITDTTMFKAMLPARPFINSSNQSERDGASSRSSGTAPLNEVSAPSTPPPISEPPVPSFQINDGNRAVYFSLLQAGLNERQARGLLYARERGRLTNRDYRSVNVDITDETARLDLMGLVDKGYLVRIGDKKGASYLPR
jgi:ATP-dependent DNA helicase RecG